MFVYGIQSPGQGQHIPVEERGVEVGPSYWAEQQQLQERKVLNTEWIQGEDTEQEYWWNLRERRRRIHDRIYTCLHAYKTLFRHNLDIVEVEAAFSYFHPLRMGCTNPQNHPWSEFAIDAVAATAAGETQIFDMVDSLEIGDYCYSTMMETFDVHPETEIGIFLLDFYVRASDHDFVPFDGSEYPLLHRWNSAFCC